MLQEKILQQNFLEKCSEFTEQKNRFLKFIVVVSVLAFFLSIDITMYAVSQPDSISGLVTMNDFGETQYIGPVSRKTIKTLMFQNLTEKKAHISLITILDTENKTFKSGSFHENKKSLIINNKLSTVHDYVPKTDGHTS